MVRGTADVANRGGRDMQDAIRLWVSTGNDGVETAQRPSVLRTLRTEQGGSCACQCPCNVRTVIRWDWLSSM
jgi:hypothetical protein